MDYTVDERFINIDGKRLRRFIKYRTAIRKNELPWSKEYIDKMAIIKNKPFYKISEFKNIFKINKIGEIYFDRKMAELVICSLSMKKCSKLSTTQINFKTILISYLNNEISLDEFINKTLDYFKIV